MVPASLNNIKNDTYDKGSGLTTVAEDDIFRSSTRAMVFDYVKNKMETS